MAWEQTPPQITPVLKIVDGMQTYYRENTEPLTLLQALQDYDAQSEDTNVRTVQVSELVLGQGGQPESTTLPIPDEPEWNQGWPTSELIPRFHVVDNGASFNAINAGDMSLQEGAEHYGNAFVVGTEVHVCENREPHDVTIRLVSSGGGNGPESTFTVPVLEEP